MQFSVIIPTRNRCAVLRQALDSLSRIAHTPGDHEIIVIDNGSVDDTRSVVERAAADSPAQDIRYVYEPVPGLLAGRHRGALEASGDICAFLDDDVRVSRDWLGALADAFGSPDTALVGGPSSPLFEAIPPAWLSSFYNENEQGRCCSWLSLFDGGRQVKEMDPCYVWGLNFSIRRQVLFDLAGFHPDLMPKPLQRYQGDGEVGLSLKLKQAALRATYHPDAAVEHVVPASRLNIEYFEARAFYQGVCDSYSQVRAAGRVSPTSPQTGTPLRRLRRFLRAVIHGDKTALVGVHSRTERAHAAGYDFHQSEVRRDPVLLEWVTRRDYWDYRPPAGWQQYTARPAALGRR